MRDFDLDLRRFRGVDLNLLVAFQALMAERSVRKAAERVFLGQPAMSHALARLRETLNDPLFVRTGNRMEPTAFAMALAPRVHELLGQASALLSHPDAFDPARAEAQIEIGIPESFEALLFPRLVGALRRAAPSIRLRARPVAADRVLDALDAEEIDLAVGPSAQPARDWHGHTLLATSGVDCLYSRRQMALRSDASLAEITDLDHVAYSYRGRGDAVGLIDGFLERRGLARRIVAVSASFVAIGRIVAEAPLVAIQPRFHSLMHRALIEPAAQLAVVQIDEPELRFDFGLWWHRRNDNDPLHSYLRELIVPLFRQGLQAPDEDHGAGA